MTYGPFGAIYNGSRIRPSGGGAAPRDVVVDLFIDWGAQVNRALAPGVENIIATDIDGNAFNIPHAVVISAGDTLVLSSLGLTWDGGTTNTGAFSTSSQAATHMLTGFDDVFAALTTADRKPDASWAWRMDVYSDVLTLNDAAVQVVGIWGASGAPANAGDRLCGSGRARQANVQVWRPAIQATGVNYTTAPGPTTNVTGVVIRSQAITAIAGTWDTSWQDLVCPIEWGIGKLQDAGLSQPMLDQNCNWLHSWATAGISGTSLVRTRFTRIRAMGVEQLAA